MKLLLALAILGSSAGLLSPVPSSGAESNGSVRFAVAHKHSTSWCYGYLTVGSDEVKYEVVQPAEARKHSFAVNRVDLKVQRWSVLGRPQPGVEIRVGGEPQVFLQLADEREVEAGSSWRLVPPRALAPDRMLQALRVGVAGNLAGGRSGPGELTPVSDSQAPLAANSTQPNGDASGPQASIGGLAATSNGTTSIDPAPPLSLADRSALVFPKPDGAQRFSGAVGFVAPIGWSVTASNGVVEMSGPVPPRDRPCTVRILAPVPAQSDFLTQAQALAAQYFSAPLSAFDEVHDVRSTSYEGVSGTGWPYVDIYGRVGTTRTTGNTVWGRVLLARLGDRVVPIVGITRSNNCLGTQSERDNDVWSLLFHSLTLPGFAEDSPILKQQLIGTWSVSGRASVVKSFAANGDYSDGSAAAIVTDSSRSGYVDVTTTTSGANGSFEVHGDRLTTMRSTASGAGKPRTTFFSIARRPSTSKNGGFEYVLRTLEHADEHVWGFSASGNYVASMSRD